MQDYGRSTYTVLFDIFKPARLIGEAQTQENILQGNNYKAKDYIHTLQKKGLIKYPEDLVLDPWCNQIYNREDIFIHLPKFQEKNSIHSESTNRPRIPELLRADSEQSIEIEKRITEIQLESEWNPVDHLDYRFSRVEVIPVDMKKGEILSANEPLKAKLLGYGVIRLYKDRENEKEETQKNEGDKTTVAILGVPFYFTASDLLLGFFDKDVPDNVSHMRLLKTQAPNRFMVLMKFRSPDKAEEFVQKYNGRHFNSMEPEACQVIFITEILFRPINHSENRMNTIPYLLDDPFTKVEVVKKEVEERETPVTGTSTSHTVVARRLSDTPYTELATCPVCLERLDSNITGLLTIPCQHTFHFDCLTRWSDDTCPVCRYSAKSDMRKRAQEEQQDEKCVECGSSENLWICLICGHVGCGRYDQAHAIEHYNNTFHCYAMEITTQRVWDYSGDNYVHRLVQNEADGKLVELPLRDDNKKGIAYDDNNDEDNEAKIEKVGLEYSKMLISQLESQREFYDMKFEESQNQLKLANDSLSEIKQTVAVLTTELSKEKEEAKGLRKKVAEGKELRTIKKQLEDESTINEGMSEKIAFLAKKNEELATNNNDLQEQVKDLMFYLDSQEKFKDASEDVKEGTVVMKANRKARRKKK